MQFEFLGFFISQIVFVPSFLVTTRKLFKPNMRAKDYIGYTLISPFCVYVLSIICYGLVSVFLPNNRVFDQLTSYADIFALIVSFIFAYLYSRTGPSSSTKVMLFVYLCYYMVGMVFSLTYETTLTVIIFSIVIPIITAFLLYRYFTIPLSKIAPSMASFRASMMLLPITAEMMLILRFTLNIVSMNDKNLWKYDHQLLVYSTIFGYIILILILICTSIITRDIDNIEIIDEQRVHLERENRRVVNLTFDMLRALVATIEAKDLYTNGHSNRVAEYAKMIAEKLGHDEADCNRIYNIALLHDIGKIAVPDAIINSNSRLTRDEYMKMKEHPIKGAEILRGIEEIPGLYLGALYHHERWDGKGYPHGLEGEQIPEVARIISVADAYDAMTSKRSYRPALPQQEVRKEIENGIGTQFYPAAARVMLDIIDNDVEFKLRQLR